MDIHKHPEKQSIKIGIDLSIDRSIKSCKSDLIDIDCIYQSVEIDDTLVSFIDLSRFYRCHRFVSEDASVLLYIRKWKLISCKQWICWQFSCNWESKDQQFIITFEKKFKKLIFSFLFFLFLPRMADVGQVFYFSQFSRFRSAVLSK